MNLKKSKKSSTLLADDKKPKPIYKIQRALFWRLLSSAALIMFAGSSFTIVFFLWFKLQSWINNVVTSSVLLNMEITA